MNGLILALLFNARPGPPPLWATCPRYARLVFSTAGPEIGYHDLDKGTVVMLDKQGKVVRTIKLKEGDVPLWFTENELHVAIQPKITAISVKGRSTHGPVAPRFFGVSGHLFVETVDVTLVDESRSISFQGFDQWAGIGIDPLGKTLAYIEMPMDVAFVSVARYVDDFWARDPRKLTPSIEKVGPCTLLPGYRDVAVLDAGHISFLGCFTQWAGDSSTWQKTLLDWSHLALSEGLPNSGKCFLFVMRLSDGMTKGYCMMDVGVSRERMGPFDGTLCLSPSGDALYVKTTKGFVRIARAELLKVVN